MVVEIISQAIVNDFCSALDLSCSLGRNSSETQVDKLIWMIGGHHEIMFIVHIKQQKYSLSFQIKLKKKQFAL